jgi:hypothetical protein
LLYYDGIRNRFDLLLASFEEGDTHSISGSISFAVVSSHMQRLAADGTVLEILGEFLITLLVHNMGTIWWLDNFFTLETRGKWFTAYGA